MFIFIAINLFIGFLLPTTGTIYNFMTSDYALFIGCFLMLVNIIATGLKYKKIPYQLRYDLYAVGATLVWFAYWPPYFRYAATVFDLFPLYFVFMTAFLNLVLITKKENITSDSVIFLQWLSDSGRFHPILVKIFVMIGLATPHYFILFPVAMTILVIRFTLASCLDNE